ncbi:hypothetical protein HHI36_017953 [Cryptolaemus montrouzieri]|uniref:Uncharacterized protein n=1 Tax=Cryptolaemus montrouzieri TaxID=559131 RepID=A0ABD2NYI5_9CUCU
MEKHKVKHKHGNTITYKKQILQCIGDFYQELYIYKDRNIEINNPNVPKVSNQGSEEISEITEDEILSAFKEMKYDKTTGVDGIEIEGIKYGGEEIIKALKVLLNKCLIEGITPSEGYTDACCFQIAF